MVLVYGSKYSGLGYGSILEYTLTQLSAHLQVSQHADIDNQKHPRTFHERGEYFSQIPVFLQQFANVIR